MKKIGFIYLFIISTINILGQDTIINPPIVESVSVNPFTGKVTTRWNLSSTSGVNGYLIYEYLGGRVDTTYIEICIKDPNRTDTTFDYPDVRTRPVKFIVSAYIGICGKKPNRSMYDKIHRTIYTSLNYDSCNSEITINWTKYQGWGDSLRRYRVFEILNGTQTDISGARSPSDSSYTVQNIQGNQKYYFYVAAYHINGDSVTSNMSCQQTVLKKLPDYIIANQAVFLSNNLVKLKFTLDPNSETKNYKLAGSDSPDGVFTTIKKFYNVNVPDNSLVVVDTLQNLAPKYYRLEALNSCDTGVVYPNMATAMVPTATVGTNQITLAWNAYRDWPNGAEYVIYRSIGESSFHELPSQSGQATNYTDNVSSLVGQQLSGNICYYVKAVPYMNIIGNTDTSRSATVCVDITANVFIPNAFTPNGDGQNDEYKPSFAFLPGNYSLTIFNRNGFKIFESSDPMKGWDGRLANNQKAAEGVYVYFIKFTSGSGKTVEKKGDFSLIYP